MSYLKLVVTHADTWTGFRIERHAVRVSFGVWKKFNFIFGNVPRERFTYVEAFWRPRPGFFTVCWWGHRHNFKFTPHPEKFVMRAIREVDKDGNITVTIRSPRRR